MKTTQELTTLIEELEKRLKSLSNSHFTLSQLIEIKDYLESVEDYLKELNLSFNAHVDSCNNYADSIAKLQEQIEQINLSIENLNGSTNISEELNSLQEQIYSIQATISVLQGDINSSIETLEFDISNLQNETTELDNELSLAQSEISTVNTTIGEHQTSLTNLQNTQTTLQTTQSNQASTINSLNTRLTKCENNVSVLTDGVDVSEIDGRITLLEENAGNTCAHKCFNFHNASPSNFTLYTREYYYSCSEDDKLYQKMKLKYESTGEGSLTINIYESQVDKGETFTVDLSQYPYEYEFTRQFYPRKKSNDIMVKVVSTTAITYKTFDLWLFGKNVMIYDYDEDVKVLRFNNKIYVTRYYDDCVKYGKFDFVGDIDINNLPNSRPYHSNQNCYNFIQYIPYSFPNTAEGTIQITDDSFLCSTLDTNKFVYTTCPSDNNDVTNIFYNNADHMGGGEVFCTTYPFDVITAVRGATPYFIFPNKHTFPIEQTNLQTVKPGEWLYVSANHQVDCVEGQQYVSFDELRTISKHEDGYFYFLNNRNAYQALQICKGGNSCTSFKEASGYTTAYISFGKYVEKYVLKPDVNSPRYYTCQLAKIFENCSYVFELPESYLLKKSGNTWLIEEPITTITEET